MAFCRNETSRVIDLVRAAARVFTPAFTLSASAMAEMIIFSESDILPLFALAMPSARSADITLSLNSFE